MSLPRKLRHFLIVLIILIAGCQKDGINPDISFTVFPDYGDTTTVFHFDARNLGADHLHVEGIRVRWDWESDSIWDTELSLDKEYARRYNKPGFYVITMEAADQHGNRILKTDTIHVMWTDAETGQFTDDRDGQVYGMVKLGGNWIMTENLRYGTRIADTVYPSQSTGPEYYLYNDNTENLSWGGLYTCYEAMNYRQQEGGQGICPNGWHVPTFDEWNSLIGWDNYHMLSPAFPVNVPFYFGPVSPTKLNVSFQGHGNLYDLKSGKRAKFSGADQSVSFWTSCPIEYIINGYYTSHWGTAIHLTTYSYGTVKGQADWIPIPLYSDNPVRLFYLRCIKNS